MKILYPLITPSTPPEGQGTITGYYSGSDCSMDSTFLEYIPSQPINTCKPLEFDSLLDNALLDDTMFLFTS
jgi:hypothetical protein